MQDEVRLPEGAPPAEGGSRPALRTVLKGLGRLLRIGLRFGLVVAVLGVGAFFFLTRAHMGQRWVVAAIVERVGGGLQGSLDFADVASPDLTAGARILGVSLRGTDGTPFISVDSLDLEYSLADLIARRLVFSDVVLYGPRVHVATAMGSDRNNIAAIFASPADEAGQAAGTEVVDTSQTGTPTFREIRLADLRVIDGRVEIQRPAGEAPSDRVDVFTDAAGDSYQRITLDAVQGVFPRVLVASPELRGTQVTIEELSFDATYFRDALSVERIKGLGVYVDGRFTVEAEELRLPGSEANGTLWLGDDGSDGSSAGARLQFERMDTRDLRWAEARIPEGTLVGSVDLAAEPGGLRVELRQTRLTLAGSGAGQVRAEGGAVLGGGGPRFETMRLELASLSIDQLRPWVSGEIPLEGRLTGTLDLTGRLEALGAAGRLELVAEDGPALTPVVEFDGVVHGGERKGLTDFRFSVDPMDYRILARAFSDSSRFGGRGRLEGEATGFIADGIRFTANAQHSVPGFPTSELRADGSVRRGPDEWVLDVFGDLAPLSFSALRTYLPDLPVRGEVSGSARASGPLSALVVRTDLSTEAGRMELEARLDIRAPGRGYQVEGELEGVPLDRFLPDLPDPSVMNASVRFEGRGLSADSAEGMGWLRMRPSQVAGLEVDTASADFRVTGGRLRLDTLFARGHEIRLDGVGELPLRSAEGEGEISFELTSDSLGGLQSYFYGDSLLTRDGLSILEREVLRLEGIDPDTLPLRADVAVAGRGRGQGSLRGSLESFNLEFGGAVEEVVYGDHFLRSSSFDLSIGGLPSGDGRVLLNAALDSFFVSGRSFQGAELDLDYTRPAGRAQVALLRNPQEDYRARAAIELDSLGGRAELESLDFRFDSLHWELEHPAAVDWTRSALTFTDLSLRRPGADSMSVAIDGSLARSGEVDFSLQMVGLHLERLARLAQREDVEVEGHADVRLRITGQADSPLIAAEIGADSLAFRGWDLNQVSATIDYRNRIAELDLRAWRRGTQVLTAEGTIPVDLSLRQVDDRVPDGDEIDLTVHADSLPAAFATAFVGALSDVQGTVAGDFRVNGTVEDPSPVGTLRLQGASWRVDGLGVRHQNVVASLTLTPDGLVAVDAEARADGRVRVTGTVDLEPLTDPGFDLTLDFTGFRAANRRDVSGHLSGQVHLGGSYWHPSISGFETDGRGLRVDDGVLYVEEVRRSASVVDLSLLRGLGGGFTVGGRPDLAGGGNPFLDSLRVDVDVRVENDTWLRSPDMNVEIAGDLKVAYARRDRNLVLVGTLEAVRGSYTVLGRRFTVQEGTVDFVGTPGVNPNLAIEADTRVRRTDGDPLDITASVTGSLTNLRLQLSSEEGAIAEADLLSYLVFGRPSYELTSGQAQALAGTPTLIGATLGSGVSVLSGTLSSQLGSLLAQRLGLDYFAINSSLGSNGSSPFSQTSLEFGRYLGPDLFWILTVRPEGLAGSGVSGVGGRLEWQATRLYNMEFFVDDRFLRSGAFGFQELGFTTSRVLGLNLFRVWSY